MLDIRWATLARSDLQGIYRYHLSDGPEISLALVERIVAAADFLRRTPLAGPVSVHGDRRKWRVPKTPYLLFYRVHADQLRVLRVLHGARDVSAML